MSKLRSLDVSREAEEKLSEYVNLLLKWNERINLISKSTEKDVWLRHIIDSAQLKDFLNNDDVIVDVGTGAGLPGIVLSILGANTTLIECDSRKVSFLYEVSRILEIHPTIIDDRIF